MTCLHLSTHLACIVLASRPHPALATCQGVDVVRSNVREAMASAERARVIVQRFARHSPAPNHRLLCWPHSDPDVARVALALEAVRRDWTPDECRRVVVGALTSLPQLRRLPTRIAVGAILAWIEA